MRDESMTDVTRARTLLGEGGHTCVAVRGDAVLTSDKAGVAPMMGFIAGGAELHGFSVADKIVGKAAALLFALAGISRVYAEVMSEAGAAALDGNGIAYDYGKLVPQIINRRGDGICPMEQAVADICEPRAAYEAIGRTIARLSGDRTKA